LRRPLSLVEILRMSKALSPSFYVDILHHNPDEYLGGRMKEYIRMARSRRSPYLRPSAARQHVAGYPVSVP
jgi:hypothetical protein